MQGIPFSSSAQSWITRGVSLLLALWLGNYIYQSPIEYASGDSFLGLLTAQSLLEKGTVQLETYFEETSLSEINEGQTWMLHEKGEHSFYLFPPGNSFLALPVVAVAHGMGMDMLDPEDDEQIQKLLAALICASIFLLMVGIAHQYLPLGISWFLAGLLVLGTSLSSTLGTALWSQGGATLMITASLFLMVKGERKGWKPAVPWLLGIFLFFAFVCRPTSALFILVALVWVGKKEVKVLLKTGITAAALLGLFVIWCSHEYGELLPPYYFHRQVGGNPEYWLALKGNLFSPGRGLFVFSPLLILSFAGIAFREIRTKFLFWLILGWFVAHLLILSTFNPWWGGWCYGPRLQTEVVPGLALILIWVWERIRAPHITRGLYFGVLFIGLVMGVFGVWVHAVKGLHNGTPVYWNGGQSIEPEVLFFDWKYPQFLATDASLDEQNLDRRLRYELPPILERLPEGASFLYGDPDNPILKPLFERYNRNGQLGNIKLLAKPQGETSFYVTPERATEVEALGYEVTCEANCETLGQLLGETGSDWAFIAVAGKGKGAFSSETNAKLQQLGSKYPTADGQPGWAAVVYQDSLIWEEVKSEGLVDYTWQGPKKNKVRIVSSGPESQNRALVSINWTGDMQEPQGVHVVLLNTDTREWEGWLFPTWTRDVSSQAILKAVKRN